MVRPLYADPGRLESTKLGDCCERHGALSESGIDGYGTPGATSTFTQANSVMHVTAQGKQFRLSVNGDQSWTTTSSSFPGDTTLDTGFVAGLTPVQFQTGSYGPFCGGGPTDVQVDDVQYDGSGTLTNFEMRFVQHCPGADRDPGIPALRLRRPNPAAAAREPIRVCLASAGRCHTRDRQLPVPARQPRRLREWWADDPGLV